MNIKDLTREQLILINTDFGADLEKRASAIVAEENEKLAELQEIAASCMAYGSELAMQKIAEMEAAHQQKLAEEDKKGLDKSEEDEDEEEEETEEEKTASAMGNFILEGYWNTMMEKGAEYYGDSNIYLEELCKEAKMGKVEKFIKMVKTKGNKAVGQAKKQVAAAGKHVAKNKNAYMAGTAAGTTGLATGAMAGRKD